MERLTCDAMGSTLTVEDKVMIIINNFPIGIVKKLTPKTVTVEYRDSFNTLVTKTFRNSNIVKT
jgi:hypothetical protein